MNRSSRAIRVRLVVEDAQRRGMIINGMTRILLGQIGSRMHSDCKIKLTATECGLHRIGGISLIDCETGKVYPAEITAQVFVEA